MGGFATEMAAYFDFHEKVFFVKPDVAGPAQQAQVY